MSRFSTKPKKLSHKSSILFPTQASISGGSSRWSTHPNAPKPPTQPQTQKRLTESQSIKNTVSSESNNNSKDSKQEVTSPSFELSDIQVKEIIGSGTFGTVYNCTIAGREKQQYAVKIIESNFEQLQEVLLLKKYRHPNIVHIEAYLREKIEKGYRHYLVMEKFTVSLHSEIIIRREKNTEFEAEEVHLVLESILKGLHFLHSNYVIHRDVKSDNILLMKHPVTSKIIRVCISDFGTSRETEMGKIYSTMTGSIMYWAPEQRVGNYNSKADIWAFGLVAIEMMNRVNTRSSSLSPDDPIEDQRLRKFSPIIKNSTMKDPKVRLSADRLLSILNSLDSDDSSDDEVHTYVEGFEKVEKSNNGLSSVLKGIHEKKPQLKSLEISKQDVKSLDINRDFFSNFSKNFTLLEALLIRKCHDLTSVDLFLPNLKSIKFDRLLSLKKIDLIAPNLEVIIFKNCPEITEDSIYNGLKICKKLKKIRIEGCEKVALRDLIQAVPSVTYNRMSGEFLNMLENALLGDLKVIDLTDHFGHMELKAIQELLSVTKTVETLCIYNTFQDTFPTLKKIFETNSSVTSLLFGQIDISEGELKLLLEGIDKNTKLQSIVFEDVNMTDKGMEMLAKFVEKNTSIKSLTLNNLKISKSAMEKLTNSISSSAISSLGLRSIGVNGKMLKNLGNSHLEILDCSGNELDAESVKSLGVIISTSASIKQVHLKDCGISDEKLQILLDSDTSKLEALSLDGNVISPKGVMLLSNKINSLPPLTLTRNSIGSDLLLDQITSILKDKKLIAAIDMSENKVKEKSPFFNDDNNNVMQMK